MTLASKNLDFNTKIAMDNMLTFKFDKQFTEKMTMNNSKVWIMPKSTDLQSQAVVWNSVIWDHRDYDLGI